MTMLGGAIRSPRPVRRALSPQFDQDWQHDLRQLVRQSHATSCAKQREFLWLQFEARCEARLRIEREQTKRNLENLAQLLRDEALALEALHSAPAETYMPILQLRQWRADQPESSEPQTTEECAAWLDNYVRRNQ